MSRPVGNTSTTADAVSDVAEFVREGAHDQAARDEPRSD
jgi:hypothetical protein